MLCENKFCIYQANNKCKLKKQELDINGMCKSCIYIKIDDMILEKLKKETSGNLV